MFFFAPQDVGSKLKTTVNGTDTGEANKEVPLKEGDVVKVGTTASVMRYGAGMAGQVPDGNTAGLLRIAYYTIAYALASPYGCFFLLLCCAVSYGEQLRKQGCYYARFFNGW